MTPKTAAEALPEFNAFCTRTQGKDGVDWCLAFDTNEDRAAFIKAALRAAAPELEKVTWLPIETAPRDGTLFLAHKISWSWPRVLKYDGHYFRSVETKTQMRGFTWQPLPTPPIKKE